MKYVIEYKPDPDYAIIHLSKRIIGEKKVSIGGGLEVLYGKNAKQHAFAQKIAHIDGVTELDIDGYKISIRKGKVFDWPEILPKTIDILAEFADGESMIEKIIPKEDKRPKIIQDLSKIFSQSPSFEDDDEDDEDYNNEEDEE